jgi:hypothetical protein
MLHHNLLVAAASSTSPDNHHTPASSCLPVFLPINPQPQNPQNPKPSNPSKPQPQNLNTDPPVMWQVVQHFHHQHKGVLPRQAVVARQLRGNCLPRLQAGSITRDKPPCAAVLPLLQTAVQLEKVQKQEAANTYSGPELVEVESAAAVLCVDQSAAET